MRDPGDERILEVAVKSGAVAVPLAFVLTVTVARLPANVPVAPEAGAVKVTGIPFNGWLPASFTTTASGA